MLRLRGNPGTPEPCHSVERYDVEGKSVAQLGAFFSMEAAEACLAQLESQGHTGLGINSIPVHVCIEDWRFDR